MASIINNYCDSSTYYSEEFFKKYISAFGNVVSAEMISNMKKVEYKLTLTNDKGEEMHFDGGLTAGYSGEGPGGTYRVLKQCGFDISEEYVKRNASFKLTK